MRVICWPPPGRLYMYVRVAALVLVAADLVVPRPIKDESALGVFFWFQVTDFNCFLGFFSLCHFIFPSYLLGLFSRCGVSVRPKGI
jgi:hypothetical protein